MQASVLSVPGVGARDRTQGWWQSLLAYLTPSHWGSSLEVSQGECAGYFSEALGPTAAVRILGAGNTWTFVWGAAPESSSTLREELLQ